MPSEYVFDTGRQARIGMDEVVFCWPKTPAQIAAAVSYAEAHTERMLFTRLEPTQHAQLPETTQNLLTYDERSHVAVFGSLPESQGAAQVAIVTAGTSDMRVALEAQQTLRYYARASNLYTDIGVAGLWRLLDKKEVLAEYPIIIAAAGMEGAIFSVLSGLVGSVLIAVPTSTGYGIAAGGHTALASALGGCSPGVLTVNIDNGFGAACAALRMLNSFEAKNTLSRSTGDAR